MDDYLRFIVFSVPAIAMLYRLWLRLMRAEQSAVADFREIESQGMKGHLSSRLKFSIFPVICFIVSPLYIANGWASSAIGLLVISVYLLMLIVPEVTFVAPQRGSVEFQKAVAKRKRGAIAGIVVLLLWVFSWNELLT